MIPALGGPALPSAGLSSNTTSSKGLSLPLASRICSSVTFFSSSRALYPYSTLPKHGARISAGYILKPAFFIASSAFHISGTIIQSCFTAMGPTGNHWLGPLARMKHS